LSLFSLSHYNTDTADFSYCVDLVNSLHVIRLIIHAITFIERPIKNHEVSAA